MRVALYVAMTVNGYIAQVDNQTPWSDVEWLSFANFIKRHKNIIIGRNSYEIMIQQNEFKKLGKPFTVVVSTNELRYNEDVCIVTSPERALQKVESKGYQTAVIAGGSQLNSSFMQQELIDEIYVDIEPYMFGQGVKLFANNNFHFQLDLIDVNKLSQSTVQLHYKIIK